MCSWHVYSDLCLVRAHDVKDRYGAEAYENGNWQKKVLAHMVLSHNTK